MQTSEEKMIWDQAFFTSEVDYYFFESHSIGHSVGLLVRGYLLIIEGSLIEALVGDAKLPSLHSDFGDSCSHYFFVALASYVSL